LVPLSSKHGSRGSEPGPNTAGIPFSTCEVLRPESGPGSEWPTAQ